MLLLSAKALFITGLLTASPTAPRLVQSEADPDQPLPCRFQAGYTSMISGDLPLVPCARLIAASGGQGMWGDNQIEVDENSVVYVNGEEWGVAVNESGTVGTLQQRCNRGDMDACAMFEEGSRRGIEGMDELYPDGWNE